MSQSSKVASSEDSFQGLMEAARAGSSEAVGELLERCRQYLWQVAHQTLSTRVQAKESPSDLVQLTCLDAHRNFERFLGHSQHELRAWLRQILLHQLAHLHRRFEQTDKRNVNAEEVHIVPGQDDWQLHATKPVATPSSRAMDRERQAQVQQALGQLPDDYRQVLVWHHRDQLSFDEMARRMQRSTSAVRKLWVRAVRKLQGLLEIADESR